MFKTIAAILLFVAPCCFAQSPWPGQAGNPVGYAAWGGSLGTAACPTWTSGTAGNPTIYTGVKCSSGATLNGVSYIWCINCDIYGMTIENSSNIVFAGTRFQSNDTGAGSGFNVVDRGINSNIYYLYCSFTPLASLYTSPPGYLWPSAGAGANSNTITAGTNAIPYADSYQYGIEFLIGPDDHVYVDHSDFWGFGNALDANSATPGPLWLTSSWMHDASDPGSGGTMYHTDGIGYLNGGGAPSNIQVIGNTLTTLGNTYDIAWEAATSGYDALINYENYVSGDQFAVALCAPGTQPCTNSAFTGNVYGTDVMPLFGQEYGHQFGTNSVWNCNRIAFRSGTTWTGPDSGWTPTSGMDGQFWISGSTSNSATDEGGNTVCATTTPAAINFKQQQKNTTSASTTITLKNTGSSTLTISSVSLATGTNFTIASNTCGASLSAGSSCTVGVTFSPTAISPYTDELEITDNMSAASSPQLVPLLGLGTTSGGTGAPTYTSPTGMLMADETLHQILFGAGLDELLFGVR
jgi:Cep192 domain 4